MTQMVEEEAVTPKQISDVEMVENYAAANAREGETPFFRGTHYSRRLWGQFYRINYYNLTNAKVCRSLFIVIEGSNDDRRISIEDGE